MEWWAAAAKRLQLTWPGRLSSLRLERTGRITLQSLAHLIAEGTRKGHVHVNGPFHQPWECESWLPDCCDDILPHDTCQLPFVANGVVRIAFKTRIPRV